VSVTPTPSDIRRWTAEVARDPASRAFLPLARAFAGAGRTAAAIRLCHQGLSAHPDDAEAHHLLGALYREAGDAEKAFDEWDITLRLDPGHAAARQALERVRRELSGRAAAPTATTAAPTAAAAVATAATPGPAPSAARPAPVPLAPRPAASAPAAARPPRPAPAEGAIHAPIRRFVARAQPEALLVIAASGRLLGQHGFAGTYDAVGVASLAAGIHASSSALARLVQEPRFAHLYQRGAEAQIFLGAFVVAGEEVIVVAVTRDESRLGLLRLAFGRLADEVREIGAAALPKAVQDAETFEHELEIGRRAVLGDATSPATGRGAPAGAPAPTVPASSAASATRVP
jgi:predicted regulator of Ras-like GTPase activity (Roadblock/LC7/MglB family)